MSLADWIGFIGVSLILLAYVLNATEKIGHKDLAFILLNLFGAALACWSSVLINYMPFIVLEGIWTGISLFSLYKFMKWRAKKA